MTETHWSKLSRMIQAGHRRVTRVTRRLPRPVKRRLSWKSMKERILSGDTNVLHGTDERMTKELIAVAPSTMKVKVVRCGLERSLTRRGQTSSRGNNRLEGCSCLVR